jgi:hypothetical protein
VIWYAIQLPSFSFSTLLPQLKFTFETWMKWTKCVETKHFHQCLIFSALSFVLSKTQIFSIAYNIPLFCIMLNHICIYIYDTFLIHSSVALHLTCFHSLSIYLVQSLTKFQWHSSQTWKINPKVHFLLRNCQWVAFKSRVRSLYVFRQQFLYLSIYSKCQVSF